MAASRAPALVTCAAFGALLACTTASTLGCGTNSSSSSPSESDGSAPDATVSATDGSLGTDGTIGVDATLGSDAAPPPGTDAATGDDAAPGSDAAPGVDATPSSDASPGSDATSGSSDAGVSDTGIGDGGVADTGPGSATSVLQHHLNASRDGLYTDPAMTPSALATLHLDAAFAGTINGNVYAQPLYVAQGPNMQEAYYVATETNHVTALGSTGASVWDKTFGTPKTGNNKDKPCGTVDPLGITGTPIIDLASRTLYFDAMVSTDNNATLTNVTHQIFAISIDDGTTKTGWPVDAGPLFAAQGTNAANQNERAALTLVGGVLYVAYAGHVGDCTPYKGIVIGIPVATPAKPTVWSATSVSTADAGRGGIWASGGIASDGTSIYLATGNTSASDAVGATFMTAPAAWSGGETVFRLASGPTFSNKAGDYYYPTGWSMLDTGDKDIGGSNPVLFDMPSAPTPHLVADFGKDGNLYLLNRDTLGAATGGGQLAMVAVANGVILGSQAAYTTSQGTYVALRGTGVGCPGGGGGNLVAVKISPGTTAAPAPTAKVAWCAAETGLGSPMVTTTGGNANVVVWSGNTRLYGYDGDTGTKVFAGGGAGDVMAGGITSFNTPINVGLGRMAVATSGHLYVFTP